MDVSAGGGSMAPRAARSRAAGPSIASVRRTGAALLLLATALAIGCDARKYNTTSRRDPSKLNVHLIPHSHDDSGWLKTVDQYYWGLNTSVEPSGVQYILDGVVDELGRNPDRTFAWAESSFLARWWAQVEDREREAFRTLVQGGQISIANGGYVQHDEACAHYESMLDQTALGHRFLLKHVGATPAVGWQLDPFGHSATQPDLFGERLGFRAVFFARSDYQDRTQRRDDKSLEYFWNTRRDAGAAAANGAGDASPDAVAGDADPDASARDADPAPASNALRGLFTVSSATGWYNAPDGFGYEWQGTEPVADDPQMAGCNVRSRVDDFVRAALDLANVTLGTDVAFLMGTDFKYQNARLWYANLDKLVHYANLDGRINVLYSSPLGYVAAKLGDAVATEPAGGADGRRMDGGDRTRDGRSESTVPASGSLPDPAPTRASASSAAPTRAPAPAAAPLEYPTRRDDLFPYADFAHAYWTGYFTSRPASKRYIRRAAAELRAARQLEVAARLAGTFFRRAGGAGVGGAGAEDATGGNGGPISARPPANATARSSPTVDACPVSEALYAHPALRSARADPLGSFAPSAAPPLSSAALEAAVALTQHHDAITGTAREHVVSDYHLRIAAGIHEARALGGRTLFDLAGVSSDVQPHHCEHANISTCGITVRSLLGTRANQAARDADAPGEGSSTFSSAPSEGSPGNPRAPGDGPTTAPFDSPPNPRALFALAYNPSSYARNVSIHIPLVLPSARGASASSPGAPLRLQVSSASNRLLYADVVPVSRATRRLQASLFAVGAPHEEDIAGSSDLWVAFELPALGYDAVIISLLGEDQSRGRGDGEDARAVGAQSRGADARTVGAQSRGADARTVGAQAHGPDARAVASGERGAALAAERFAAGRASARVVLAEPASVETVVPARDAEAADAPRSGFGALLALASGFVPSSLLPPAAPASSTLRLARDARRLASGPLRAAAPAEKTVTNGLVSLHFDATTGLLAGVTPAGALRIPVNVTMGYYLSDDGNRPDGPRQPSSGAYLFRPKGYVSLVGGVPELSPVPLEVVTSTNLVEVRQEFAPYASLTTRLRTGSPAAELEWSVGPIPVATGEAGREVVLRVDSDVDSKDVFWTDANGRELQRRQRGRRESYRYDENEPVAANYYPITAIAAIRDEVDEERDEAGSAGAASSRPAAPSASAPRRVLALVTDRAQGASSLAPGRLEVMLHRRILVDDERGVVEPLDETDCRERAEGKACEPRSVRGLFRFVASAQGGLEGAREAALGGERGGGAAFSSFEEVAGASRAADRDADVAVGDRAGDVASAPSRVPSAASPFSPLLLRRLAHEATHGPLAWFTALTTPSEGLGFASGSLLKHAQDPRIDLLTLQALEADEGVGPAAAADTLRLFVRVAHVEVDGDDAAFGGGGDGESSPVAVALRHLLPFDADIARVVPVSPSGNRDLSVEPGLAARIGRAVGARSIASSACGDRDLCASKDLVVDLHPGEILSFQIDVVLAEEARPAASRDSPRRAQELQFGRFDGLSTV